MFIASVVFTVRNQCKPLNYKLVPRIIIRFLKLESEAKSADTSRRDICQQIKGARRNNKTIAYNFHWK